MSVRPTVNGLGEAYCAAQAMEATLPDDSVLRRHHFAHSGVTRENSERPIVLIAKCLEDVRNSLLSGAVSDGMELLARVLLAARSDSDTIRWKTAVMNLCRSHGILATLLLDPFTARSFYKPRGYPGDAELLDLIYRAGRCYGLLHETTDTGRLIYQYSSNRDAPNAVRWRCRHIAELIDDLAQRNGPLRILSIASGHARELTHCLAAHSGGIREFVALDADEQSLDVLANASKGVPITRLAADARMLLRSGPKLGTFDLVYSLGLFDYLSQRAATRLLAMIAKMVRPGGYALAANFAPGLPDAGYMEAFMDWWLVYRDEPKLRELCDEAGMRGAETYSDPSGCLALVTWTRRD